MALPQRGLRSVREINVRRDLAIQYRAGRENSNEQGSVFNPQQSPCIIKKVAQDR